MLVKGVDDRGDNELVFLRNAGDSCLVEFEVGAFRDLDHDGGVFHVVDDTVESGGGDDLVTGFESGDTGGLFLALALLGTDEKEIEQHDHHNHHEHRVTDDGLWALGSGSGSGEGVEELDHGWVWLALYRWMKVFL